MATGRADYQENNTLLLSIGNSKPRREKRVYDCKA